MNDYEAEEKPSIEERRPETVVNPHAIKVPEFAPPDDDDGYESQELNCARDIVACLGPGDDDDWSFKMKK
jgi:hypothetical protein